MFTLIPLLLSALHKYLVLILHTIKEGSTILCPHIDISATLGKAIRLLALEAVYHLVVVDKNLTVHGVLSPRDIAAKLLEIHEDEGFLEERVLRKWLSIPVGRIARKPAIALTRFVSIAEAAKLMYLNKIGLLPVVDNTGKLINCYEETMLAIHLIGDIRPAKRYATADPLTLSIDDKPTLLDALAIMVEERIRHVLLERSRSTDIIDINNLLLAIARRPLEGTLLEKLEKYTRPATILPADIELGTIAELVTLLPERAVVLTSRTNGEEKMIITTRDLLKAMSEKVGKPT